MREQAYPDEEEYSYQRHTLRTEAAAFRLTLSNLRRDLEGSDEDEDASVASFEASRGTSPDSPAQSLEDRGGEGEEDRASPLDPDTDRNSLSISDRSSLDVTISFHDGEREPQPVDPWMAFLDQEISSTRSSGEQYTHCALLILREYFGVPARTTEFARRAADILAMVNEEYLVRVGSWEVFEHAGELQGFLWLVWGALIEVVVRMGRRGDEVDAVVLLVRELLRRRRRQGVQIMGKSGRSWEGSEIPVFRDIWPSAYVGFGLHKAGLGTSRPFAATPEEWITLLSFLGRLTAAGLTESWEREVWALDDCLGEETWANRAPDGVSECLVVAAAEFLSHAGQTMAVNGSLSTGWARSMCLAKWNHWQGRFAEVAELFEGGPGPVQWASWYAREHMFEVGEWTGFTSSGW